MSSKRPGSACTRHPSSEYPNGEEHMQKSAVKKELEGSCPTIFIRSVF